MVNTAIRSLGGYVGSLRGSCTLGGFSISPSDLRGLSGSRAIGDGNKISEKASSEAPSEVEADRREAPAEAVLG